MMTIAVMVMTPPPHESKKNIRKRREAKAVALKGQTGVIMGIIGVKI